jgi:very-short-patch-repair endonuclease
VGRFVLDFYCPAAKLAVELDGGVHTEPDQAERDAERTIWLNSEGIHVLRFWNSEVLGNTEMVKQAIWNELTGRMPSSGASRHLLPPAGEGREK